MVAETGYVLDCSVALALGLPDEDSDKVETFFKKRIQKSDIWIPALFWYEIANALAVARRRKRITRADHTRLSTLYTSLPLMTDALIAADAFVRYGSIACEQNLSAYDAAYLELAYRRSLVLATLDKKLAREAEKSGVQVWGK